jgi:hypothetical protein
VHNVRSFLLAGCLTAVFVVSQISSGVAGSADHRANASYSSSANGSQQMSRAEEPVPANCIRQSCGKLWCWQMRNGH